MSDDFCVFILTHGRPDKVFTYKTILEKGYTGKVFFVVDDEDKTKEKYIELYGDKVLIFSKNEIVKKFDQGDNFSDRRAIIYARNVCFDLAEQVGCKYFIQLDDDYTDFRWSFTHERKYVTNKYIKNLDKIFAILLKFYKSTPVTTLSMAQGGDFIGGEGSGLSKTFLSGQISRKCMNSFICSTERKFHFMGRINEDVNTYCNLGNKGHIFMTIAQLRLEQKQTQSNSGGMTELYLNSGTYVKSFYSVMYNPSSVTIRQMGQSNKRLHHSINWDTTVPKIIAAKHKKITQPLIEEEAMKIPELNRTIEAIDAHHEANQGKPRPHMGCSTLGHACDRWLWLSFRWAVVEPFKGRILRLFRRGQNEEATVVADLRAIGMKVQKTGENQSRVDFGCHVSGSVDGVIESGVLESTKPHVLEIKTHGLKSFTDLEKNGVEKSKFMHYVQMQLYMMGLKLERAFYFSICKDDDRIYTERVRFDKAVAVKALERGHRLVKDARLPPPISTDATWYECKFCAAHEFCHKSKVTKEVNCRTCAHSTAKEDGTWLCEKYDHTLSVDEQRTGCAAHVIHPDLVPWKFSPSEHGVIWHTPHGDIENSENGFHSSEIVANVEACASGDKFVGDIRSIMGGRVVG